MRTILILLVIILPLCAPAQHKAFHIASYSQISVPARPTEQEKYMARLIKDKIQIHYQKTMKIYPQDNPPPKSIVIGRLPAGKAVPRDPINIEFSESSVFIHGKENKDLLYAGYTFLEDFLGIYRFTPTVEKLIPANVSETDLHYSSPFIYRRDYSYGSNYSKEFNAVLREDGDFAPDAVFGKPYTLVGFVHTFAQILPASKYFKQHPEWFLSSGQIKKMKPGFNDQEVQLCLSDPEAYRQFVKNLLAVIQKNSGETVFSVSQNDGGVFCECTACTSKKNKSTQLLEFINRIAQEIEIEYPDVFLETLFYADAIEPPTVRPRKNVIVRLALINSEIGHPIDDLRNVNKKRLIDSWAALSRDFIYWDYALNSHPAGFLMPQPGFRRIGKDLQYLKKAGMEGYFVQSYLYNDEFGFMTDMKTWVLSRLLWNPDQHQEMLISFFIKNNYGAAYREMDQLYNLIENAVNNINLPTYDAHFNYLTDRVLDAGKKLLADALQKTAADPVVRRKIEREQFLFNFAELYLFKTLNVQKKFRDMKTDSAGDFTAKKLKLTANLKNLNLTLESERKILQLITNLSFQDSSLNVQKSIIIQEDEFQIYGDPSIAGIKTDQGKKVAYLNGNNLLWGITVWFSKYLPVLQEKEWIITAKVRIKIKEKKDNILLNVGVYSADSQKNKTVKNLPIEKFVNNKYVTLSLPPIKINEQDQLWFYVDGNCQCIDQLLIDYIELTPANENPK
ncbi:DUF4838 domain-containing protein [Chryseobacterium salivictor]|uniref:DUF4838 domain-containing protein n=1 Tax=Chryseobacterium salivictor TaxID=2547600 RepID=A0A4V1AKR7_9FLAO|nr:DUF4838 domain-containing protein [Chryseobacterium salivictor]QBO57204.1 hypothetical protein NBC122_00355 [Chryseobacterium salivictor]